MDDFRTRVLGGVSGHTDIRLFPDLSRRPLLSCVEEYWNIADTNKDCNLFKEERLPCVNRLTAVSLSMLTCSRYLIQYQAGLLWIRQQSLSYSF